MTALFFAIAAMLAAGALMAVYRIVRGPSILDRMVASDMLLTTLMLAIGTEMVYNQHTRTVPVLLVLATTAIFATVTVARYVAQKEGGEE